MPGRKLEFYVRAHSIGICYAKMSYIVPDPSVIETFKVRNRDAKFFHENFIINVLENKRQKLRLNLCIFLSIATADYYCQ